MTHRDRPTTRRLKPAATRAMAATALLLLVLCLPAQARTIAVVIGIDKYVSPNISQLKAAVADAKAFAEALGKYAGLQEEDVKLLTSQEEITSPRCPTKANIVLTLEWAQRAAKPEDTFIFYFAGHGISRWEKSYLLPIDANTASANVAAMTSIAFDDLKLMLGAVRCAHQIVVMDCCRNDPETGRGDVDNVANKSLMRDVTIVGQAGAQQAGARSSSVLFSCSEGERAFERTDGKNGVFTYYLVRGLSGEAARGGEITFEDLAGYVETKVPTYFANEPTFREGTKQTPWHKSEGSGRVTLAKTGQRDVVVTPVDNGAPAVPETLATTATLKITGTPQGARVYVDGQEVGTVPCEHEVDLGVAKEKTLELTATAAGYKSVAARVLVKRGQTFTWTAELEQKPTPAVKPPAGADEGDEEAEPAGPDAQPSLTDPPSAAVEAFLPTLKRIFRESVTDTKETELAAGWPTYNGMGWTVQYPPDWTMSQATAMGAWFTSPDTLSHVCVQHLDQLPGNMTLEQLAQTVLNVLTANAPSRVLATDKAKADVGDMTLDPEAGDSRLYVYRWMHPQGMPMFAAVSVSILARNMGLQTTFGWACLSCPEKEVAELSEQVFIPMLMSSTVQE